MRLTTTVPTIINGVNGILIFLFLINKKKYKIPNKEANKEDKINSGHPTIYPQYNAYCISPYPIPFIVIIRINKNSKNIHAIPSNRFSNSYLQKKIVNIIVINKPIYKKNNGI